VPVSWTLCVIMIIPLDHQIDLISRDTKVIYYVYVPIQSIYIYSYYEINLIYTI